MGFFIRLRYVGRARRGGLYRRQSWNVFCGFWNDAYGGKSAHFGGAGQHVEKAYHGPPVLRAEEWKELRRMSSPLGIATALTAKVRASERSFHFNHQMAWSRAELADLLLRCGFLVHSMDSAVVARRFSRIPGVMEMYAHSLYCVASRNENWAGI